MNTIAIQKKDYKTNNSRTAKKPSSFFGPTTIQKKLNIGASNDAYEVEADRVADQVVGMSDVQVQKQSLNPLVQRKCPTCEDERVQKKSLADGITPLIQKKEANSNDGGVASDSITSQINSNKGSGRAMDNSTKSHMESRFGTDFSNVRLHTGSNAIQLSQELNAQAFTVGNDIYFNQGKYNTTTTSGKHLLAHELTHTIQQKGIQRRIQKQCDASKRSTAKQADIQIFLIADDNGSSPTIATNMINVDRVWEKCCIHMNVLSPITISKTDYKTLDVNVNPNTRSPEQLALMSNAVSNKINVFFVKTFRDQHGVVSKNHTGGGRSGNGGSSKPFSILVEGAVTSVVAHEIGHALGQRSHISGTIMEGSGAYNAPNPEVVSGPICNKVRTWPHLRNISSEEVDCCMRY